MFREYVNHTRTHDKLLGARSDPRDMERVIEVDIYIYI